jgi:hypothetical protein
MDGLVMYETFNTQLYAAINALSAKLPHLRKQNNAAIMKIRKEAKVDESAPMGVWKKIVGDDIEMVMEVTPENLEKLKAVLLANPDLFGYLDIEKNWSLFTETDFKNLYAYLSKCQEFVTITETLDPTLMLDLQDMILGLEKDGKIDFDEDIDIASVTSLLQTAMQGNAKIQNGIERLKQTLGTEEERAPESYSTRMNRARNDM